MPIKIGIDATVLSYNQEGIGNYVTQLLLTLDKSTHPHYEFILFTFSDFAKKYPQLAEKYKTITLKPPRGSATGIKTAYRISRLAKSANIHTLISTHSHLLPIFFRQTLWIIHDISPLSHPQFFGNKQQSLQQKLFRLLFGLAVRRSAKILTVSEFSKVEVLENFNVDKDKVVAIGASWGKVIDVKGARSTNSQIQSVMKKLKVKPEQYFFCLGTLSPRKNVETILRAFARFQQNTEHASDYKLIVAGKNGWDYDNIFHTYETLLQVSPKLKDKIIFTGFIDNRSAKILMEHCAAFISASHYEGFGIPPLEALLYDRQILLSDIPVYKEIYASVASFFSPDNSEELASLLETTTLGRHSDNRDARTRIIETYSWERVAENLLANLPKEKVQC